MKTLLIDLDNTLLSAPKWPVRLGYASTFVRELGIGKLRGFRAVASALRALEGGGPGVNAERAARAAQPFLGLAIDETTRTLERASLKAMQAQKAKLAPVPGAREFLAWARGRFRLVLATNPLFDLEVVLWRVDQAGVDRSLFEFVSHAGNMHATKPKRAYYEQLLEHIDARAGDCVLIGDSVRKDLPAEQYGIRTFLINRGFDEARRYLERL